MTPLQCALFHVRGHVGTYRALGCGNYLQMEVGSRKAETATKEVGVLTGAELREKPRTRQSVHVCNGLGEALRGGREGGQDRCMHQVQLEWAKQ